MEAWSHLQHARQSLTFGPQSLGKIEPDGGSAVAHKRPSDKATVVKGALAQSRAALLSRSLTGTLADYFGTECTGACVKSNGNHHISGSMDSEWKASGHADTQTHAVAFRQQQEESRKEGWSMFSVECHVRTTTVVKF